MGRRWGAGAGMGIGGGGCQRTSRGADEDLTGCQRERDTHKERGAHASEAVGRIRCPYVFKSLPKKMDYKLLL